MTTKFRYRFDRVGCLGNKYHVLLRRNNRAQPLAKYGMVVNAQDANWLCVTQRSCLRAVVIVVRASVPDKGST